MGKLKPIFFSLFLCLFYTACLETLENPEYSKNGLEVSVCIMQNGNSCSYTLQATPADSFELKAVTTPEELEDSLDYYWVKKKTVLSTKKAFTTDTSSVPDSLIAKDKNGNSLTVALDFIFDTTPELDSITVPRDSDTLYGNESTAFTFSFHAEDKDKGDTLFYTFEADSTSFYAGTFTSIIQSGFSPGKHKFRIIVKDILGLSDTLSYRTFFVKDTSGESK